MFEQVFTVEITICWNYKILVTRQQIYIFVRIIKEIEPKYASCLSPNYYVYFVYACALYASNSII